jgi:hypothetical protein
LLIDETPVFAYRREAEFAVCASAPANTAGKSERYEKIFASESG